MKAASGREVTLSDGNLFLLTFRKLSFLLKNHRSLSLISLLENFFQSVILRAAVGICGLCQLQRHQDCSRGVNCI